MRIIDFQSTPVHEFRYLNAGRSAGSFFESRIPVHCARVDRLPEGVAALVATADLQGRELFEESLNGSIRLLGEALPRRLVNEVFPMLRLHPLPDVLLVHDGPDGPLTGQRGLSRVRELLEASGMGLVIRGHAHWEQPLAEFPGGLQVLNVDERVVVLRS
ncbi:MAG: metallophosphoesterase family protein [Planctomycetales bacterium]